MTTELKQTFTRKITQANSTEMVVILYDMTLAYLDDAENAADENEAINSVGRARACLVELMNSLHFEYEPAGVMYELYRFCIRTLGKYQASCDSERLTEIRNIIVPLRDAYNQLIPVNEDGPVMGNSQHVYAGLTYGKGSLNINLDDKGVGRGFYA